MVLLAIYICLPGRPRLEPPSPLFLHNHATYICWWIKTNQWWLESGASGVWDFGIWRSLTCLGDPLVKSLRVTIRESLGVWIYIGALPALSLCPKRTQDNLKQRHIISTVRSKHSSCGPGSSNDYASIMVQMFILFTSECTVHSR